MFDLEVLCLEILAFVFGDGWELQPKKYRCPTIACVIFGHGCQLAFSNAHN
jgi:hypothetical protein